MTRWGTARLKALDRDGYKCRRCLRPAYDVHHRVVKGMGGTADPDISYGIDNLVSLCRSCHDYVHAHPRYGYESGFLVHSGEDPAEIPMGRHCDDWLF